MKPVPSPPAPQARKLTSDPESELSSPASLLKTAFGGRLLASGRCEFCAAAKPRELGFTCLELELPPLDSEPHAEKEPLFKKFGFGKIKGLLGLGAKAQVSLLDLLYRNLYAKGSPQSRGFDCETCGGQLSLQGHKRLVKFPASFAFTFRPQVPGKKYMSLKIDETLDLSFFDQEANPDPEGRLGQTEFMPTSQANKETQISQKTQKTQDSQLGQSSRFSLPKKVSLFQSRGRSPPPEPRTSEGGSFEMKDDLFLSNLSAGRPIETGSSQPRPNLFDLGALSPLYDLQLLVAQEGDSLELVTYLKKKGRWLSCRAEDQEVLEGPGQALSKGASIVFALYRGRAALTSAQRNILAVMKSKASLERRFPSVSVPGFFLNAQLFARERGGFSLALLACPHNRVRPAFEDVFLPAQTRPLRILDSKVSRKSHGSDLPHEKLSLELSRLLRAAKRPSFATLRFLIQAQELPTPLAELLEEKFNRSAATHPLASLALQSECPDCLSRDRTFALKRVCEKALFMSAADRTETSQLLVARTWMEGLARHLLVDTARDKLARRNLFNCVFVRDEVNKNALDLLQKIHPASPELVQREFVAISRHLFDLLASLYGFESALKLEQGDIVPQAPYEISLSSSLISTELKVLKLLDDPVSLTDLLAEEKFTKVLRINESLNWLLLLRLHTRYSVLSAPPISNPFQFNKKIRRNLIRIFETKDFDHINFDGCLALSMLISSQAKPNAVPFDSQEEQIPEQPVYSRFASLSNDSEVAENEVVDRANGEQPPPRPENQLPLKTEEARKRKTIDLITNIELSNSKNLYSKEEVDRELFSPSKYDQILSARNSRGEDHALRAFAGQPEASFREKLTAANLNLVHQDSLPKDSARKEREEIFLIDGSDIQIPPKAGDSPNLTTSFFSGSASLRNDLERHGLTLKSADSQTIEPHTHFGGSRKNSEELEKALIRMPLRQPELVCLFEATEDLERRPACARQPDIFEKDTQGLAPRERPAATNPQPDAFIKELAAEIFPTEKEILADEVVPPSAPTPKEGPQPGENQTEINNDAVEVPPASDGSKPTEDEVENQSLLAPQREITYEDSSSSTQNKDFSVEDCISATIKQEVVSENAPAFSPREEAVNENLQTKANDERKIEIADPEQLTPEKAIVIEVPGLENQKEGEGELKHAGEEEDDASYKFSRLVKKKSLFVTMEGNVFGNSPASDVKGDAKPAEQVEGSQEPNVIISEFTRIGGDNFRKSMIPSTDREKLEYKKMSLPDALDPIRTKMVPQPSDFHFPDIDPRDSRISEALSAKLDRPDEVYTKANQRTPSFEMSKADETSEHLSKLGVESSLESSTNSVPQVTAPQTSFLLIIKKDPPKEALIKPINLAEVAPGSRPVEQKPASRDPSPPFAKLGAPLASQAIKENPEEEDSDSEENPQAPDIAPKVPEISFVSRSSEALNIDGENLKWVNPSPCAATFDPQNPIEVRNLVEASTQLFKEDPAQKEFSFHESAADLEELEGEEKITSFPRLTLPMFKEDFENKKNELYTEEIELLSESNANSRPSGNRASEIVNPESPTETFPTGETLMRKATSEQANHSSKVLTNSKSSESVSSGNLLDLDENQFVLPIDFAGRRFSGKKIEREKKKRASEIPAGLETGPRLSLIDRKRMSQGRRVDSPGLPDSNAHVRKNSELETGNNDRVAIQTKEEETNKAEQELYLTPLPVVKEETNSEIASALSSSRKPNDLLAKEPIFPSIASNLSQVQSIPDESIQNRPQSFLPTLVSRPQNIKSPGSSEAKLTKSLLSNPNPSNPPVFQSVQFRKEEPLEERDWNLMVSGSSNATEEEISFDESNAYRSPRQEDFDQLAKLVLEKYKIFAFFELQGTDPSDEDSRRISQDDYLDQSDRNRDTILPLLANFIPKSSDGLLPLMIPDDPLEGLVLDPEMETIIRSNIIGNEERISLELSLYELANRKIPVKSLTKSLEEIEPVILKTVDEIGAVPRPEFRRSEAKAQKIEKQASIEAEPTERLLQEKDEVEVDQNMQPEKEASEICESEAHVGYSLARSEEAHSQFISSERNVVANEKVLAEFEQIPMVPIIEEADKEAKVSDDQVIALPQEEADETPIPLIEEDSDQKAMSKIDIDEVIDGIFNSAVDKILTIEAQESEERNSGAFDLIDPAKHLAELEEELLDDQSLEEQRLSLFESKHCSPVGRSEPLAVKRSPKKETREKPKEDFQEEEKDELENSDEKRMSLFESKHCSPRELNPRKKHNCLSVADKELNSSSRSSRAGDSKKNTLVRLSELQLSGNRSLRSSRDSKTSRDSKDSSQVKICNDVAEPSRLGRSSKKIKTCSLNSTPKKEVERQVEEADRKDGKDVRKNEPFINRKSEENLQVSSSIDEMIEKDARIHIKRLINHLVHEASNQKEILSESLDQADPEIDPISLDITNQPNLSDINVDPYTRNEPIEPYRETEEERSVPSPLVIEYLPIADPEQVEGQDKEDQGSSILIGQISLDKIDQVNEEGRNDQISRSREKFDEGRLLTPIDASQAVAQSEFELPSSCQQVLDEADGSSKFDEGIFSKPAFASMNSVGVLADTVEPELDPIALLQISSQFTEQSALEAAWQEIEAEYSVGKIDGQPMRASLMNSDCPQGSTYLEQLYDLLSERIGTETVAQNHLNSIYDKEIEAMKETIEKEEEEEEEEIRQFEEFEATDEGWELIRSVSLPEKSVGVDQIDPEEEESDFDVSEHLLFLQASLLKQEASEDWLSQNLRSSVSVPDESDPRLYGSEYLARLTDSISKKGSNVRSLDPLKNQPVCLSLSETQPSEAILSTHLSQLKEDLLEEYATEVLAAEYIERLSYRLFSELFSELEQ